MTIAFCISEAFPFAKTGGLADVGGSLPSALEKLKMKVILFLPRYKGIDIHHKNIEKIDDSFFKTTLGKDVDVYFVENKYFFERDGLYGDSSGDYPDNLERYQYFCFRVLKILKQLNIKTDIVHCHDWQTSLLAVYLKEMYGRDPFYAKTKTLLTIHNLSFQGIFPKEKFPKLQLNDRVWNDGTFEFYDKINLLKAGIQYSDAVSTVSKQYAKEIQTKEFGCGLEGVLRSKKKNIVGILNGLDEDKWNPQRDHFLKSKYSAKNFEKAKLENKIDLQRRLGFTAFEGTPLFGFVGRLTEQKGIDLILECMDEIMNMNVQVIVQGVGEERFSRKLRDAAVRNPQKLAVHLEFDEEMAHRIYAGSDIFLMPSKFEPCGLGQMISLRYGTIPLVFKTGGLDDTMKAFDPSQKDGNGFVFERYQKEAFLQTMKKAVEFFHQKDLFQRLIKNAFRAHFPWSQSAREYQRIYQCLLSQ